METISHSITFNNTAKASYTATSTSYVKGGVYAVRYIQSTGTQISSTADLVIKSAGSSMVILDSLTVGATHFTKAPRYPIVNTTNGAIANSAGIIVIPDERISVTVSAASSTAQTGTFVIYEG